jgi:hypothetical protein
LFKILFFYITLFKQVHEKEAMMKRGIREALFAAVCFAFLFISYQTSFAAEKVVELNVPACGT